MFITPIVEITFPRLFIPGDAMDGARDAFHRFVGQ
jgi:hypothetical protein